MTSVDSAGSTTMQNWMVDILFARPGQDEAAPPPAASTALSAIAVASAAKSGVAPGTGQAMAALQAGGATVTPGDGARPTGYTTVAQYNAQVAANNAMTSAQISAALYSGIGIPGLDSGETDTFATIIQVERDAAQNYVHLADDPAQVAALRVDADSLRAWASQTTAYADSMQKAFDNHTLVIQKLSDVPGLNFTQRETFLGRQDSQPDVTTWTGGYDQQAMHDFMSQFKGGKHAGTPLLGGVALLVTWTDESLT